MSGSRLTPGEARKKHREAFNAFWSAYPRKVAPAEAENVFAALMESKGLDPVRIVAAARAFADRCGEDLTYVPSPHSWLKQGRYDDADLFTDERAGQVNWMKQQWRTGNVRAVENRFHITMPKQYPPDDMTNPDDIRFWHKEICRAWITTVYKEKFEQCRTPSQPTTSEPSSPSSGQSSSTQPSLGI